MNTVLKLFAKPRFNWIDLVVISTFLVVGRHYGQYVGISYLVLGGILSVFMERLAYGPRKN